MPAYTVLWEIELDADTPEEAARQALQIHRDPTSIATIFSGYDAGIDIASWLQDDHIWTGIVSCKHEPDWTTAHPSSEGKEVVEVSCKLCGEPSGITAVKLPE